jgi:hypothetical protein
MIDRTMFLVKLVKGVTILPGAFSTTLSRYQQSRCWTGVSTLQGGWESWIRNSLTSAPLTSERSVDRPKGPAVLPARVEGPGGCHPHPVRPNGPTVPRTARASRGMVGPLGRHMSLSVLPGPLGRAGRTAGPLGRKAPAAPAPRATTNPSGVSEGSRGSSAATTPGPRPPRRQHPEGGARKRGSTGPTRTTLTERPADRRVRPRS